MGKIVENYSLQELIGQGGYGKVFRGFHVITRQQVAVKVIKSDKFKEIPKLEECTVNEINTLSSIEPSPHIVRYLDMLKTSNNYYFIYEFCNGGTLGKVIQNYKNQPRGAMPLKLALDYFKQLLEAFRVLTINHIMHRDLKPDNILLHNNRIKVADFGFCKSLEGPTDIAQTMLGSPIYMAPEVIKGEPYSMKADIWSLGVVLYEMLYGFCPFNSSSIAKLIQVLEKEDLKFPVPTSPNIENLLNRILSKDPRKRIDWSELFELKFSEDDLIEYGRTSSMGPRQFFQRKPLGNCNIQERKQDGRSEVTSQKSQLGSNSLLKNSDSGSSSNSEMLGSHLSQELRIRQRKSAVENISGSSFYKHSKNPSNSIFKEGKPIPRELVKQHDSFSIIIRACLDLLASENCRQSFIITFIIISQIKKDQNQILSDLQKYYTAQQLIENQQISIILSTFIQQANQLKAIEQFLRQEFEKIEDLSCLTNDKTSLDRRAGYLRMLASKSTGLYQKSSSCSIMFLQIIDYFEQLGCLKSDTYRCLNKEQLAQSVLDRLAKMT